MKSTSLLSLERLLISLMQSSATSNDDNFGVGSTEWYYGGLAESFRATAHFISATTTFTLHVEVCLVSHL